MQRFFFIIFLFSTIACARKGEETFREESRSEVRALITTLETINTIEDLLHQMATLKNHFLSLADLMLEIRKYRLKNNVRWEPDEEDLALSDEMRHELHRVLRLEGAKILMEKCQSEALKRLAAGAKKIKTSSG